MTVVNGEAKYRDANVVSSGELVIDVVVVVKGLCNPFAFDTSSFSVPGIDREAEWLAGLVTAFLFLVAAAALDASSFHDGNRRRRRYCTGLSEFVFELLY